MVYRGDILIVDDTPDNLRFLSAMLLQKGYEVRSVTNGKTALMGIQAQPPDLILLDVFMPEMNGYEVCQQLKQNPTTQSIPIIFLSVLDETLDKVKAFEIGARDYITKPFQEEEVLARIENQLTICRLNQRIEQLAAIEERNRIARDIHDSLGNALVSLNIQLEAVLALWQNDPEQAYASATQAKQLGSEALKAVRASVSDLRSQPLSQSNLNTAIIELLAEFQRNTGIIPKHHLELPEFSSEGLSTCIYRMIQEGLTNICKYAEATAVNLRLVTTPAGVSLVLEDNGKGFPSDRLMTGFGLQGMEERTALLGGRLEIDSAPGQGCRIVAEFPRQP
jgi:two-component system, sensor histidine kinase and response regulator